MIKINLLPPESIKKEERKEIFVLICVALSFIALIGLGRYGLLIFSYQRIQNRIYETEQELRKYESIVKQVESLKAAKAVLENKKNVIGALMTKRLIYPKFMEDFLQLLPSNIWFESMNTTLQEDDKMEVILMAKSLDNFSIADFLNVLSVDSNFADVEMGAISTAKTSKDLFVSTFKLNFIYRKKEL